eukprot:10083037-Heterocapsa_arctica.AAC.1
MDYTKGKTQAATKRTRSSGSTSRSEETKLLDKNKKIKHKPAKAEEPNSIANDEANTLEQWWERQQAAAVAAVAIVGEEEIIRGLKR